MKILKATQTENADIQQIVTPKKKALEPSKTLTEVLNFRSLHSLTQLMKNNYIYLIALVAILSPESVWGFYRMDKVAIDHDLDMMSLTVALIDPENSACAQLV
jgi:predicted transcriptional regulator